MGSTKVGSANRPGVYFWVLAVAVALMAGAAALYVPPLVSAGTLEGLPSGKTGVLNAYFASRFLLSLCYGLLMGAGFSRLPFLAGLQPLLLTFCALIPFWISWGYVVAVDVAKDPTSHNLLPFEFVVIALIFGAPLAAGQYAGRRVAWLSSRRKRVEEPHV